MIPLDDRLRAALRDLDDRAAAHVTRPRAAVAPARRRTRRAVPALAAVAVAVVLVGIALALRPAGTGTPEPPATRGTATPTPAPSPTVAPPPAQSAADARRDGVYPQVAALPLADRTARPEGSRAPVSTPEGRWQLAHPRVEPLQSDQDGCVKPVPGAPAYRLCGGGYAEIQLLSADGARLLRAYPFPELSVDWIEVTPDAVYCGRAGDGGLPESMLCRIDRGTGALTGRVYACDGPDCGPLDDATLASWPGTWSQGTRPVPDGFDGVRFTGENLLVTGPDGDVTIEVDPRTLRER
jgi:hypothetical protein